MVAAPISAYLVKVLPINILAICVGGLIIFTNSNALLSYFVKIALFQIQFDSLLFLQSLFCLFSSRSKQDYLFLQEKPSKQI